MNDCVETQLIPTRYGDIAVKAGSEDLIVNFLHHYGEWAGLEVEFLAAYLPKSARVLDLGGYLGTFSMGLAGAAQLGFIGIVEGNPAVLPLLERNAQTCLPCPYEVVPALVVDPAAEPIAEGWADVGNAGSGSFIASSSGGVRIAPVSQRIALGALLERFGPLDLVKLDVEGMEGQLIRSCPEVLDDDSILLWLECNESAASIELARQLLESGRPLSYFAWPSHNPNNFNGAGEAIFPFAHEAGLLLGAEPRPLTPSQQQADCILRRIFTLDDLREAMWCTPRWAPSAWTRLGRSELAAVAGHMLLGNKRETFLAERSGPEGQAQPSASQGPTGSRDSAKWLNLMARQGAENFRLKQLLLSQTEVQQQCARDRAADEATRTQGLLQLLDHLEAETAAFRARAQLPPWSPTGERSDAGDFEEQLDAVRARLSALLRDQGLTETELRAQIADLSHRADASARSEADALARVADLAHRAEASARGEAHARVQLERMQASTTWRAALRLSRAAGCLPFLKRSIKALLRVKQALA